MNYKKAKVPSLSLMMDSAFIYKGISPTHKGEAFLKFFEIFALDNLTGSFEVSGRMSEHDIETYVRRVGDTLGNI